MAIPKLFKMWISKIIGILANRSRSLNPFSLLVDLNGLLHRVAQHVFGYGVDFEFNKINEKTNIKTLSNFDRLKQLYLSKIKDILTLVILDKIRPTDILILCIDGVAPFAKVNQQRIRRQKSGKDKYKEEQDYNKMIFDTSYITAGLPFMNDINKTIYEWIETNKNKLPTITIFSDSSCYGEGEHKMFNLLSSVEKQLCSDDINKINNFRSKNHIVYGLDADISILCCLKDYNLLWMREFRNLTINCEIPQCVDISVMKTEIYNRMIPDKLRSFVPTNSKNVFYDFILMLFLIGDDFVPGLFTISFNINKTINCFFEYYHKYLDEISNFVTDNYGAINVYNFKRLLFYLTQMEEFLYNYRRQVDFNERNRNTEHRKELQIRDDDPYYISDILFNNDYPSFNNEWSIALSRPYLLSNYRTNDLINEIMSSSFVNELDDICFNYINMLQWNLYYYVTNDLNQVLNNYYYKYTLSPTIYHLSSYLERNNFGFIDFRRNANDFVLNPSQLIAFLINPLFSKHVIESFYGKKYDEYIKECKYIKSLHPVNFQYIVQGKYLSEIDQKIPILPPIIIEDILKVKSKRNQTTGEPRIYYNGTFNMNLLTNQVRNMFNESNNQTMTIESNIRNSGNVKIFSLKEKNNYI